MKLDHAVSLSIRSQHPVLPFCGVLSRLTPLGQEALFLLDEQRPELRVTVSCDT